jgi:hypothetical protein
MAAARPVQCAALGQAPAAERRQVVNRTDDGLNVVFLQQRQPEASEGGGQEGQARRSVNTGWGNNFVRIDMKVGL